MGVGTVCLYFFNQLQSSRVSLEWRGTVPLQNSGSTPLAVAGWVGGVCIPFESRHSRRWIHPNTPDPLLNFSGDSSVYVSHYHMAHTNTNASREIDNWQRTDECHSGLHKIILTITVHVGKLIVNRESYLSFCPVGWHCCLFWHLTITCLLLQLGQ